MELKICISPQFRAIDPPNPARGFIQQNENVRFATAACMQKYGNVSFATVACAKCMRYGGRGGVFPVFSLLGNPLIDMDLRNACTCIESTLLYSCTFPQTCVF